MDRIGELKVLPVKYMEQKETLGQAFGRLGGLATSKAHGKAHYRRMALLSAIKRRKNKKGKQEFDVRFVDNGQ